MNPRRILAAAALAIGVTLSASACHLPPRRVVEPCFIDGHVVAPPCHPASTTTTAP